MIKDERRKPKKLCAQDCPNRTPTCHSTCREYLEYYSDKRRDDEKRVHESNIVTYKAEARKRCKRTAPIIVRQKKMKTGG